MCALHYHDHGTIVYKLLHRNCWLLIPYFCVSGFIGVRVKIGARCHCSCKASHGCS